MLMNFLIAVETIAILIAPITAFVYLIEEKNSWQNKENKI